jgi:hypothetical protein
MPHVFLLSPAYCGGRRAKMLLRHDSSLPLAVDLRERRLTLGAAFAFMSALYFRGKLAYASAFDPGLARSFVITPTRGLQSPQLIVTAELLNEFAAVDVAADEERYRAPLELDAGNLARSLPADGRVVLLGSIASGKYVDVLGRLLGDRLFYPAAFVGRGDMSRGGLLLRSSRSGRELDYVPIAAGVRPRGPRPGKLGPERLVRLS